MKTKNYIEEVDQLVDLLIESLKAAAVTQQRIAEIVNLQNKNTIKMVADAYEELSKRNCLEETVRKINKLIGIEKANS